MRTGLTKKQKTTVIYFDEHMEAVNEHNRAEQKERC